MKTNNTNKEITDIFEIYNTVEISKELRLKIRTTKNEILKTQYPDNCFTTEEHAHALNEACIENGLFIF